jgi:Short C-terminal domain
MSQQQSQTVQVIQKNGGCFSGCGTVFAVLLLIGLTVAYWYVALPLAILLIGGGLWYRSQKKKELPAPKMGAQDPWLNRIAIRLSDQGYAEQTRNTGQQLSGSPLSGDLVMDGHGMRLFVNVMSDEDAAIQTANKLRVKPDFQKGAARKTVEILTKGQLVFIARSQRGVLDSTSVHGAVQSVAEILPAKRDPKTLEAKTGSLAKPGAMPKPQQDVFADIQKLAALRDSGAITEKEFEAKKAELLNRL